MSENQEEARRFFAGPCDFVLAAAEPDHFPDSKLPEVAFIGRSNVGKSSLINALTGRKGLARTSSTPGRTQQVVFFDLAHRLMLVDLPGYGHADAPREEKDNWSALVQYYMRQRRQLKCVFLLLDGRHGTKANDLEMMKVLDRAAITYKAVVTKMDGVKPFDHDKRRAEIAAMIARHPAALDGVILTSSEKKQGIDELQSFMMRYVASP